MQIAKPPDSGCCVLLNEHRHCRDFCHLSNYRPDDDSAWYRTTHSCSDKHVCVDLPKRRRTDAALKTGIVLRRELALMTILTIVEGHYW